MKSKHSIFAPSNTTTTPFSLPAGKRGSSSQNIEMFLQAGAGLGQGPARGTRTRVCFKTFSGQTGAQIFWFVSDMKGRRCWKPIMSFLPRAVCVCVCFWGGVGGGGRGVLLCELHNLVHQPIFCICGDDVRLFSSTERHLDVYTPDPTASSVNVAFCNGILSTQPNEAIWKTSCVKGNFTGWTPCTWAQTYKSPNYISIKAFLSSMLLSSHLVQH